MKQRRRIYYTESQKALMWERWRRGDSLQHIARRFDRNHSSVQGILVQTVCIQPAQRHRSRLALTLAEREEISRSVVAGLSIRSIASRLGRAPSTISRELQRNGGSHSYRANQADELAWARARRPKTCKLVRNRTLAQVVAAKLRLQWSPEQIAGWLKRAYAVWAFRFGTALPLMEILLGWRISVVSPKVVLEHLVVLGNKEEEALPNKL